MVCIVYEWERQREPNFWRFEKTTQEGYTPAGKIFLESATVIRAKAAIVFAWKSKHQNPKHQKKKKLQTILHQPTQRKTTDEFTAKLGSSILWANKPHNDCQADH